MALVYFGGVVAALLARTKGRAMLLVVIGAAALAYFGYAWSQAARNAQDIDYSCSHCGQWLGRYWEGWLVLFFAALNWIGWTLGVLLGAGARLMAREYRELQEQRGAVSSRH